MKVSIVLPAYNQEKYIKKAIENFTKISSETEIIVVANGCTDNTVNIVKNLQKKLNNLKLLEFPKKIGKGKAITEGFKVTNGDIIGFIDADDAFESKGIKFLFSQIKLNECDCAIASKWKDANFFEVPETFIRKVASRVWNNLVKTLFMLNLEDTQGGAKFLKRIVFENIGTDFYCKGFEMDVELLWRISKKRYSIKEVFVKSSQFKESTFNLIYSLPMFFHILRLRLKGV